MNAGAIVKAFDPIAQENAKGLSDLQGTQFMESADKVVAGSDLIVLMTEWNEFKEMEMAIVAKSMKTPKLLDGRNIYDPQLMKKLGFEYMGVGR